MSQLVKQIVAEAIAAFRTNDVTTEFAAYRRLAEVDASALRAFIDNQLDKGAVEESIALDMVGATELDDMVGEQLAHVVLLASVYQAAKPGLCFSVHDIDNVRSRAELEACETELLVTYAKRVPSLAAWSRESHRHAELVDGVWNHLAANLEVCSVDTSSNDEALLVRVCGREQLANAVQARGLGDPSGLSSEELAHLIATSARNQLGKDATIADVVRHMSQVPEDFSVNEDDNPYSFLFYRARPLLAPVRAQ